MRYDVSVSLHRGGGVVTACAFVILQVLRMLMPLRASENDERQGLDINAHGEEAYNTEFTM